MMRWKRTLHTPGLKVDSWALHEALLCLHSSVVQCAACDIGVLQTIMIQHAKAASIDNDDACMLADRLRAETVRKVGD